MPTFPLGGVCDVKAVGAVGVAAMVMLKETVFTLPKAFCAFITILLDTPAAVGVPERTPLAESVKPAGSAPETSEYVGAG